MKTCNITCEKSCDITYAYDYISSTTHFRDMVKYTNEYNLKDVASHKAFHTLDNHPQPTHKV